MDTSGVYAKGSMTQACCPSCRLRFDRASAAHLLACPTCAQPLHRIAGASDALGYRLFDIADPRPAMPVAGAVALPMPPSAGERS
jgi:hypothetical protein